MKTKVEAILRSAGHQGNSPHTSDQSALVSATLSGGKGGYWDFGRMRDQSVQIPLKLKDTMVCR